MATEHEQPAPLQALGTELTAKFELLKASATQQYSLKNYTAAAEFYSEAAEIQDEINGEMSLDNADLLYQYGRCLYHVAVSNSDVLGGKVAGSSDEPKRKKRKVTAAESSASVTANGAEGTSLICDAIKDGEQKLAEDVLEAAVEEKDSIKPVTKDPDVASKPYFQITGDENWTDSEDEADEADADAAAEEEEDDFATAYEILDMARVLLSRKLSAHKSSATSKSSAPDPDLRALQERLADTHDLQAEISLENERFLDAINDTRDALALKVVLYPTDNSLVAEAHFKLSLALEFASVTAPPDDDPDKPTQIDEALRSEAASEMSLAIASCRARVKREEAALASLPAPQLHAAQRSVADVKEMIADMEQRLVDLRNPAVSLSGLQAAGGVMGAGGADAAQDPLRGVLGAMLGESKAEQAKRLAAATEGANDLSGLVKKRKGKGKEEGDGEGVGKGKRKAVEEGVVGSNGKKVKFEE